MRALLTAVVLIGVLASCVSSDDVDPTPDCGDRPQMPGLSFGESGPYNYSVTRSTLDADIVWRAQVSDYMTCLESIKAQP